MENPERLIEGTGSELERALVQELCSYRGPRDMRVHTLAAIGVTGATGLAAGGALAWWSGKAWYSKLLLAVSVASLLGGVPAGYFFLRQKAPAAVPPPLPAVAATQPQLPLPTTATAAPATAAPLAAGPLGKPTTTPEVVRPHRSNLDNSANLRAELITLDQARSTLAKGDFPGALALLDEYFRTFRHGRLQLEAEVLRIDALARYGQGDAARAYAKDFVRRHPKSVHAARLQSIVEP